MAQAYKIWAREKKIWEQTIPNNERLKQAQNVFYCIVRKTKRKC